MYSSVFRSEKWRLTVRAYIIVLAKLFTLLAKFERPKWKAKSKIVISFFFAALLSILTRPHFGCLTKLPQVKWDTDAVSAVLKVNADDALATFCLALFTSPNYTRPRIQGLTSEWVSEWASKTERERKRARESGK